MRRKVIQHGLSTMIVSLPAGWVKRQNIRKGDEIDISEVDQHLIISGHGDIIQQAQINIDEFGCMSVRAIKAMYKKGVDELVILFSDPRAMDDIQTSIGRETVGYEIVEHSKNRCLVRKITGELDDFDSIQRRTILLLIQMGEGVYECIKTRAYEHLNNIALLEGSNNRFTTTCRRMLNKRGYSNKVGPMYALVEDIENIADEYKYVCNYFLKTKATVSKPSLELFKQSCNLVRLFYDAFYSYTPQKIVAIKNTREKIVDMVIAAYERKPSGAEAILLHHTLAITERIFAMTSALMVLRI